MSHRPPCQGCWSSPSPGTLSTPPSSQALYPWNQNQSCASNLWEKMTSWWCHDMVMCSALLALKCMNPLYNGPVIQGFDICFVCQTEQVVEQTVKLPVIRDNFKFMQCHSNVWMRSHVRSSTNGNPTKSVVTDTDTTPARVNSLRPSDAYMRQ